ncbi:MAG: nucleoside hydrolase [Treponema sp.]|jgi:inosine-uridine nucleoside N-ribohydrolase|nr:nucleoside hydrolase [Treponema sp.]
MEQDNEGLLRRLRKPAGPVDVVIDTDTYNEIDDQYALAYLIKSPEKLNLKGIYAAPFFNQNSSGPADGMEKSYNEIFNVLELMGRDDLKGIVQKGSAAFLSSETEPVESPAARTLAELAMGYSSEKPLYVIAIGAITNIASALLIKPEIQDRIVIVWLGGNALHWPDNKEFNCYQDVAAARIVFDSGAALVQLPCMGVVSAFATSGPELEYWLRGKNKLCDYLVDYTTASALKDGGLPDWTRAIWDVTAVAWLLDGDFMLDRLEHCPIPEYNHHYSIDPRRHFYRYVYHINRDKLFEALFNKLAK